MMRILLVIATLSTGALCGSARAAQRLAVLPLRGPGGERCGAPESHASRASCDALAALSAEARAGALQAVERAGLERDLQVMAGESLAVLAAPKRAPCPTDPCELEAARALGADYVVSGQLRTREGSLRVGLELREAHGGALLATARAEGQSFRELVQALRAEASALVSGGLPLEAAPEPERSGPAAASEVRFGGGEPLPVPATSAEAFPEPARTTAEAERALELALDLEESGLAPYGPRAEAWCALARLQGENPYRAAAMPVCLAWQRFLSQREVRAKRLARDAESLHVYLGLRRKSMEKKRAAIGAFLEAYADFAEDDAVAHVRTLRASYAPERRPQAPAPPGPGLSP